MRQIIRGYIGRYFDYFIIELIVMSIYFGINQILMGTQFFVVLLMVFYIIGFTLSLKPKYSYYGYSALSASVCMMLYFSITYKIFKINSSYTSILSGIISLIVLIPFILLINYININFNKSIILSTLTYPLTYLSLYYIESTNDINAITSGEMFILILSLFMIMLSLAILMNQGLREKKIQKIFNYSDLLFFSSLKNKLIVEFNGYDKIIEILISDFRNSILSYVEGDYSKSIINLYVSIEGIKRIYEKEHKIDFSTTGYKKEFKDILEIRSKIAHSNVGKKIKIYSKYRPTDEETYNTITTAYKIVSSDLSNVFIRQ